MQRMIQRALKSGIGYLSRTIFTCYFKRNCYKTTIYASNGNMVNITTDLDENDKNVDHSSETGETGDTVTISNRLM